MIRLLVVDDHPVVREGLVALLEEEPDFVVAGDASSAEDAIRKLNDTRPNIVVMDAQLPRMSGIEASATLRERVPGVRVIILTSSATETTILDAFAAGARGFVVKESEPSVLRSAVRTVASGGTFIDPRVAPKLIMLATRGRRMKGPFGLSLQELRVVERLPRGLTYREIGGELGISDETVKSHVRNAMRKLGAKDRAEAAAIAIRKGLA